MPSFATEIRPLFRDRDVQRMAFRFDLSSYDDVKEYAEPIYERLMAGDMPCDGPWPAEQIALFRRWIDEGLTP